MWGNVLTRKQQNMEKKLTIFLVIFIDHFKIKMGNIKATNNSFIYTKNLILRYMMGFTILKLYDKACL